MFCVIGLQQRLCHLPDLRTLPLLSVLLCAAVLFPVLYAAHLAEEGFSQPTGL